jgi:hypothetical protein
MPLTHVLPNPVLKCDNFRLDGGVAASGANERRCIFKLGGSWGTLDVVSRVWKQHARASFWS